MSRILDLLEKTSRTFALSIPLLPEPLDQDVAIAYLLFRVADTLEDTPFHPVEEKRAALAALAEGLAPGRRPPLVLLSDPRTDNPHDRELLESLDEVLVALESRPEDVQAIVRESVRRSALGMKRFLYDDPQQALIRLVDLGELVDYCYVVAGLVGEMLTDLFVRHDPALQSATGRLRPLARGFGEALQLVNILKDRERDAADGRFFIPQNLMLSQVFERARHNLDQAERFIGILQSQQAHPGIIRFCQLPVRLAAQTLEVVESQGAGSKLSRRVVAEALQEVMRETNVRRDVRPHPPASS